VSFFIGFPLLTGCGAGRDQPNHFFALFIGEQCVNNNENRAWANFANGVVPFLILIVKNVSNRHSVWVIEDQGGGWEINAVSREVVFVLLLVVFESHPVTQIQDYHDVHTHVNTVSWSTGDRGRRPPPFPRCSLSLINAVAAFPGGIHQLVQDFCLHVNYFSPR
jgi:hypothetical protein